MSQPSSLPTPETPVAILKENGTELCEVLNVQLSDSLDHIRQLGTSAPVASYRGIELLLVQRPKIDLGISHVITLRGKEEGGASVLLEHVVQVEKLFIAYGKLYL